MKSWPCSVRETTSHRNSWRSCGYFFLATAADARPRLRPFGMICTDGEELLIVTDTRKSVSSDLEKNKIIEAYPSLHQKYPEGQEMFLAIYRIHIEKAVIL